MNGSLLITARPFGFFSNLIHVIDNLKYCEINNLKPIINLNNSVYNNGNSNFWNLFFKDINNGIPEGTIQESNIMKLHNYIVDIHSHKCLVWDACQKNNLNNLQDHRKDVFNIINKYLILNDNIQELINKEVSKIPDKILSVHMRCTDYKYYNFDEYYNAIDSCIDLYDGIFVASDTHEAINAVKNRYKNVFYYDTSLRTDSKTSGVLCFAVNRTDIIKHATDVLVECIILSKAKKLICINSCVALVASYFNPYIDINMISRSPSGG